MKVAVIYASTTGNTQQLAQALADGAKAAGKDLLLAEANEADGATVLACDQLFLGSPAMGSEQLEDSMEDFFSSIEGSLSGKQVGLFGSYDWGDGQWLSDWADRVKAAGASLLGTVKANLAPEAEALEAAKALGAK